MPGMSGLEVAKRLRATQGPGDHEPQNHSLLLPYNRHIDICAVTTDLEDWQLETYRKAGMNGVIGKPLKEDDIRHALQLASISKSAYPFPTPIDVTTPRYPTFPILTHTRRRSSCANFKQQYAGRATYAFYFRLHGTPHPLPLPTLEPETKTTTSRPPLDRLNSISTSSVDSPSFPTARTTPPLGWNTLSTTSSIEDWQGDVVSNEQDPFAAGFGAALSEKEGEEGDGDEEWDTFKSQARTQLISRRSIPLLGRQNQLDHQDWKRETRSDCGSPDRPTYRLVWLGIKSQSVLKDGPLLDEMLNVMAIEDSIS
ncbi:hypothetical protein CROQUDRAFT_661114 [Cronartium quercuum f. sp. fusiforme G11]|uniref:Response regulatory domain-containing protein n=1 Tax=Cronartium quercuum f. sp. fusiforme G11 TaxID=708437 RepID=A0A9P6T8Y3_9BASI|nr:hypothetical protein CROQUDRAFT_661114 [Cronartium quercuum f. sp. fusiforme G11]